MKKELIRLANHLDRIGRVKEANYVDNLLLKYSWDTKEVDLIINNCEDSQKEEWGGTRCTMDECKEDSVSEYVQQNINDAPYSGPDGSNPTVMYRFESACNMPHPNGLHGMDRLYMNEFKYVGNYDKKNLRLEMQSRGWSEATPIKVNIKGLKDAHLMFRDGYTRLIVSWD